MPDISEKNFEATIESLLLTGGRVLEIFTQSGRTKNWGVSGYPKRQFL
jgi:hypothetical protein